jgi:hypothetical protein
MVRRLPEVLSYILHVDSLLALGVLAVVISLLEWMGTLPSDLSGWAFLGARSIWAVYFYLVARKAAVGSKRLPVMSDYIDTWDTLFYPLLQVALASAWYILVLLVFAHYRIGIQDFVERFQAHPISFLSNEGRWGHFLLTVGLLYLPFVLLGSLCRRDMLRSMDPSFGFRLAARVPWAYTSLLVLISLLGFVGYSMDALGSIVQSVMPIPLAAPVLNHILRLWVPLAQARLFGGFVYCNRAWLQDHDEHN